MQLAPLALDLHIQSDTHLLFHVHGLSLWGGCGLELMVKCGCTQVREELAERKMQRRLVPYALPVAFSTWAVLVWYVFSQGT